MQAVEAIAACLGQQGLDAGTGDLLLFLTAAFLLLVALGRILLVFRRLFHLTATGEGQAAGEAPELGETGAARLFPLVANLIASLYIPAALLAGTGLAGKFILAEPGPLVFWLEVAGLGLGLLSAALLFLINHLARDPYVGGGLAGPAYDRPVLCTNMALMRRGTNRLEVVLVTVLVVGSMGWQLAAPTLDAYLPPPQVDCPPPEEPASSPFAYVPTLPSWDFARLPNRGEGGAAATQATPELRLAHERSPSVWLRLASHTFSVPPIEPEPEVALNLVRPVMRPNELYPGAPLVPPPNLFGTIVQPTRMAPAAWQVRVHTGYREFTRCLDEGASCARNAGRWADFAARTRGLEGVALYAAVNEFVNSTVVFQADGTLEEVLDDWITPATLIESGEGDCEDFALAKFWLLEMLGVDKSDLYIVVVQDLIVHLPHAFLAVRDGDDVWLLDSRTDRPLTPDEMDGVVPVITIGDRAAYLHGRPVDPGIPMSLLMSWLPFS